MKKIMTIAATVFVLILALSGSSCDGGQPAHTKQTLLNGSVVGTFTIPAQDAGGQRYLTLVFNDTGVYKVSFALGPSEGNGAADRDKPFIPHSHTYNITEPKTEIDIAQQDWPTYFSVTITDSSGQSDQIEFASF